MLLVNEEYKTFLSGRVPPKFDEDNLNHPILVDWYKEQMKRCIEGYEYKGYRITGDHYFMLNFVPIRRVILDNKGNPTNKFEIEYPLWTQADDRIFKQIEEAKSDRKDFLLMTARGAGKELADYEPVITKTGYKSIGTVTVGEQIYDSTGKLCNITGVYPQGLKPIYRLTLSDGRYVDCGLDHLWEVYVNNRTKKVLRTRDMIDNLNYLHKDKIIKRYFIKYTEAVEFEEKEYPIHPYILGAMLGDGTMTTITPKIATDDIEMIDKFRKLLPDYEIRPDKSNNNWTIVYRGKDKYKNNYENGQYGINPLHREIKKLGLNVGCKAKFIPEEYKYGSIEQRMELVRGLLDTDGSINKNGCIEFTNTNERLVDDLIFILQSLGIKCLKRYSKYDHIFVTNSKIKSFNNKYKSNMWRVFITTDKPVFFLSRKLNRIHDRRNNKNNTVSIDKIEYIGDFTATCISVDSKDKLFLTKDFIVTHNTYIAIALGLKEYICFKKSHAVFAGASKDLIAPTFNQKLIPSLNELEARHLFLKQKRRTDTDKLIISGEIVDTGKIKKEQGRFSVLERIIFNTEGATAGRRATFTCFEEIGEFSNNPSLKDCINNTRGTANVGGIKVGFTMYIGTGGSVSSDQARDIFFSPGAYGLYVPEDCDRNMYPKGHAVFIPVYKKYGGFYEQTGYSDEEGAKLEIERVRKEKESDLPALNKFIQQYPLTPNEVFMKNTIKVFNSLDLANQTVKLQTKILNPTVYIGRLERVTNKEGEKQVVFVDDPNGKIKILKHPEEGKFKNLYCMGVDSIDMGNNDSADKTGYRRSKLACLVKQRTNPDNAITDGFNNSYVAMYLERSDDVEDDYEQVMLLAMYYDCNVMLEYTKTTIKTYFKQYNQDWRFCKRPDVASNTMKESESTIGFKATPEIINHYIGKIKHYLKEYANKIFFQELCEQLIDYDYENKGKFDLIAAMGGCELHDEQLSINFESAKKIVDETMNTFGYYTEIVNGKKVKKYGAIPKSNLTQMNIDSGNSFKFGNYLIFD